MHTFKKQRKEPLRPPFGKQNIKAEEVREMVGNYIGIFILAKQINLCY